METGANPTRTDRVRDASRRRREQQKQELRQTILSAAADLFVEQGYEGFSMRGLAERIGYSATTIYLYFENKEDLLFAVIEEGFERFLHMLTAAAESTDDPWERIGALAHAYVRFGLQNPAYYQAMFMPRMRFLLRRRTPESAPPVASFMVLQRAVQGAIDAGVLRPGDARTYSDVLWTLVHGVVGLALMNPTLPPDRIETTLDVAVQMASDGLRLR